MSDEKEYWKEVEQDAKGIIDDLSEAYHDEADLDEELYESLNRVADNEAMYYWKVRRILRWTNNEQAILDEMGEISSAGGRSASVFDVLSPIAYWAYRQDVMDELERMDEYQSLRDMEDNPRPRKRKATKAKKRKTNPSKSSSSKTISRYLKGL